MAALVSLGINVAHDGTRPILQIQKDEASSDDQKSSFGVEEDWRLSQFWYDKETCNTLADEALDVCQEGLIACVAAPSAFHEIQLGTKARRGISARV
eukprot:CAMPEP_0184358922 /NCGR_PEP_ID=MMETSP1089-20130417/117427_1 /TAXON_ID=38269 ORGANISM="Gloeochaete wittrockiana, Strain SAG46.84" /NCGR_SAMPLE_ID=MMETSP1089 /ASSEMBLY_ACC=CAM_ASM_000445 /LENGTH=96 /DNA_ID=CAMNT_0026697493 /DNA_START=59 /DNA_END=349 /DNA_ORIENTATION=+